MSVVSVAFGLVNCGTSAEPAGGAGAPSLGSAGSSGAAGSTAINPGGGAAAISTGGTAGAGIAGYSAAGANAGGTAGLGNTGGTGGVAGTANGRGGVGGTGGSFGGVGGNANGGGGVGGTTNGGTANGGGTTNGGDASGGTTNGGTANGGGGVGGNANGGNANGGNANGGTANGGTANGGGGVGGTANGGGGVGGNANGGAGGTTGSCNLGTTHTGGTQHCSNSQGNLSGGYSYQLWSNGTGSGCMTPYGGGDAAFKANWNQSSDFLARVGLGWNETQTFDQLGTIASDFAYTKTGSGGGFSFIGIYGWSNNPLIEFYIVEDWYGSAPPTGGGAKKGSFSVDGGTYNIYQHQQNEQPSIHGTATFQQFFSMRQTPRQCGHISISEHFKKWASLGMTLGKMEEARILVEVGGGTGSIDFTTATLTAK